MIQQVPTPPTPPPFDPNLIFLNDSGPPIVVLIVIACLLATTIILWPIMRALARRLEGKGGGDAALRAEVDQLHHRLDEMDALQVRVRELEERLDFAERLLTRGQEATSPVPRGDRA